MGSWLPTINVGDFVGNLVGDFKNGEKNGGNENNRYYKA